MAHIVEGGPDLADRDAGQPCPGQPVGGQLHGRGVLLRRRGGRAAGLPVHDVITAFGRVAEHRVDPAPHRPAGDKGLEGDLHLQRPAFGPLSRLEPFPQQRQVSGVRVIRRIVGGTEQVATLEITEFSPPAIWAARGVDGPVRVSVRVTVDPLDDGARSRVTLAVDFAGSGAGRMLIPVIVRPQAAREAPRTVERLRQRLEDR